MSCDKVIYLITGPIGSGKSTYCELLYRYFNLSDMELVSTDMYYNLLFKSNCNRISDQYDMAKRFSEHKLKNLIKKGESFVWETVLAKKEKIEFLKECIELGYSINGMFIGVSDFESISQRVKKRHAEGCYDIPIEKILSRYIMTMKNISYLFDNCDVFIGIDNTTCKGKLIIYKVLNDIVYKSKEAYWITEYLENQ